MHNPYFFPLILNLLLAPLQANSENETTWREGTRGLHVMIFTASIQKPLQASIQVPISSDFAARITRTFVPGGESTQVEFPSFGFTKPVTLEDVFLFYPGEGETRELDRRKRRHDNEATRSWVNIEVSTWDEQSYSLLLDGRYIWPFKTVAFEGQWESPQLLAIPAGKKNVIMIAVAELDCLQKAVFGTVRTETETPDPDIKEPQIISQTAPEFPYRLLRLGWTGEVMIRGIISKDGRIDPKRTLLLFCSHPLLAKSSLHTVIDRWSFRPATHDGNPIDLVASIQVSFAAR
jgi:hypothetical protein